MRAEMIAWLKDRLESAYKTWCLQMAQAEWRSEMNQSGLAMEWYDKAEKTSRDIAMLKAIIAELERLDAGEGVG